MLPLDPLPSTLAVSLSQNFLRTLNLGFETVLKGIQKGTYSPQKGNKGTTTTS